MSLLFWGLTLGTIGKVLLGLTVLMVHSRIIHEHRIDRAVLKELKRERAIGILGVVLIVAGFIFEILFYNATPLL